MWNNATKFLLNVITYCSVCVILPKDISRKVAHRV